MEEETCAQFDESLFLLSFYNNDDAAAATAAAVAAAAAAAGAGADDADADADAAADDDDDDDETRTRFDESLIRMLLSVEWKLAFNAVNHDGYLSTLN